MKSTNPVEYGPIKFHPRLWERGLYEKAERLFLRAGETLSSRGLHLLVNDLDEERHMWELTVVDKGRRVDLTLAASVAENLDLDLGSLLVTESVRASKMKTATKNPVEDELLNTRQAAAALGVQPSTLIDWRSSRRRCGPPFIRVSARAVRYRKSDLMRWLAEREIFSKSGPVTVEDLRRFYGDAIPGIVSMTAAVLGITPAQIIKMARHGLLEYASLQEALRTRGEAWLAERSSKTEGRS